MSITIAIIAFTTLVSIYSFDKADIKRKCMLNPFLASTQNQYYRFVTSGFLHQDFTHLLWNMFSLYFFGTTVERTFRVIFEPFGGTFFIAFYIIAIVVSDIPSFFKHRHNPGYNSLGASGAVAAVIFASIIFQPLAQICIYFALCLPGFILGVLYLIGSYYQSKRGRDNINHDAHIYGALFGVLFCAILYPASIPEFIAQIASWRFWE